MNAFPMHQQCFKKKQTVHPNQALPQSHHPDGNCDYKAWLHCEFDIIDNHSSRKIVMNLTGRLTKARVISPRFNVPSKEPEKNCREIYSHSLSLV